MREGTIRLGLAEAGALCGRALERAGAAPAVALSLARSVVAAEAEGNRAVGLAHLPDYLDALRAGRLDGRAVPALSRPAPALFLSDARGGAAHSGFDGCFEELATAARTLGCAVFAGRNGFPCGALGFFAARLAERGLVALAATNGPALLAAPGSAGPVYCTNPLAFAAPAGNGPPLVFDQSSSPTAFVNLRAMAERGEPLPEGWAIDGEGRPTTDARQALRGAMLAFGGARGANVALMVEVLAAGLTGARWSLDASPFDRGAECPNTGLFVLALAPAMLDPGFAERLGEQMRRLAGLGVHVPGLRRAEKLAEAERDGILISHELLARIEGS